GHLGRQHVEPPVVLARVEGDDAQAAGRALRPTCQGTATSSGQLPGTNTNRPCPPTSTNRRFSQKLQIQDVPSGRKMPGKTTGSAAARIERHARTQQITGFADS